jgi:hypothetical protein
MTTPSSQPGIRAPEKPLCTSGQPGTSAEALRAAAGFIESAGLRGGLSVMASDREIRIHVGHPYHDAVARRAVVIRLAGLIGGTVRQDDTRDYPAADLRADGAIGGLRAVVETYVLVRRARAVTGVGKPLAEQPGGQITAVPGRLPEGWRWVTELDARPKRQAPWKPRRTAAPAMPEGKAARLAARDCPPLTSAALQAATRQATAAQPARPASTAHRVPRQPSW